VEVKIRRRTESETNGFRTTLSIFNSGT
jgi:hypothetical protein